MTDATVHAWIGIRNSDTLRVQVATFIDNIRAGNSADQVPLLATIMESFLDEAITALVLGAADAMRLHGLTRKVVDVMVSTTRSTCHLLSKRVLRKMKNADVRELADYMDVLRQKRYDRHGQPLTYTGLPVDDVLMARVDRLRDRMRSAPASVQDDEIIDVILGLIDVCVEHLYVRTLRTLTLGPIAARIVDMGYRTVHHGAHAMIHRVVPSLTDAQTLTAIEFCYGLLIPPDGTAEPAVV
ncbi:MAG: hypothetical protein Q8J78_15250 [Moraxellaceae bacterium]|nr:hypothetical protein [Moraxellaceae bacterium]